MEYHSNIKEYQSNIIDVSKSNINLSEGNSPSSDSDVNMSEVHSQPSVPAENSPVLAAENSQNPGENAPAPAPVDGIQHENELEEEANNRITDLYNAIQEEENLVDETGDLEKEIDDSLIVDRNGEILDTEDNNRKRNREEDSSDDEDFHKRSRFTYDELETERDILDTKEEQLSNAGKRIYNDIDRLKEIKEETGRATTRRAIEEALDNVGPRAESPDSKE
jgi:hypothetical protein